MGGGGRTAATVRHQTWRSYNYSYNNSSTATRNSIIVSQRGGEEKQPNILAGMNWDGIGWSGMGWDGMGWGWDSVWNRKFVLL